jgi:hypothetical protein
LNSQISIISISDISDLARTPYEQRSLMLDNFDAILITNNRRAENQEWSQKLNILVADFTNIDLTRSECLEYRERLAGDMSRRFQKLCINDIPIHDILALKLSNFLSSEFHFSTLLDYSQQQGWESIAVLFDADAPENWPLVMAISNNRNFVPDLCYRPQISGIHTELLEFDYQKEALLTHELLLNPAGDTHYEIAISPGTTQNTTPAPILPVLLHEPAHGAEEISRQLRQMSIPVIFMETNGRLKPQEQQVHYDDSPVVDRNFPLVDQTEVTLRNREIVDSIAGVILQRFAKWLSQSVSVDTWLPVSLIRNPEALHTVIASIVDEFYTILVALEASSPRSVLVDSGETTFDALMTRICATRGIPSLCVLEPIGISSLFSAPVISNTVCIAVPGDKAAHQLKIKYGFPEDRILVSGSPYLDRTDELMNLKRLRRRVLKKYQRFDSNFIVAIVSNSDEQHNATSWREGASQWAHKKNDALIIQLQNSAPRFSSSESAQYFTPELDAKSTILAVDVVLCDCPSALAIFAALQNITVVYVNPTKRKGHISEEAEFASECISSVGAMMSLLDKLYDKKPIKMNECDDSKKPFAQAYNSANDGKATFRISQWLTQPPFGDLMSAFTRFDIPRRRNFIQTSDHHGPKIEKEWLQTFLHLGQSIYVDNCNAEISARISRIEASQTNAGNLQLEDSVRKLDVILENLPKGANDQAVIQDFSNSANASIEARAAADAGLHHSPAPLLSQDNGQDQAGTLAANELTPAILSLSFYKTLDPQGKAIPATILSAPPKQDLDELSEAKSILDWISAMPSTIAFQDSAKLIIARYMCKNKDMLTIGREVFSDEFWYFDAGCNVTLCEDSDSAKTCAFIPCSPGDERNFIRIFTGDSNYLAKDGGEKFDIIRFHNFWPDVIRRQEFLQRDPVPGNGNEEPLRTLISKEFRQLIGNCLLPGGIVMYEISYEGIDWSHSSEFIQILERDFKLSGLLLAELYIHPRAPGVSLAIGVSTKDPIGAKALFENMKKTPQLNTINGDLTSKDKPVVIWENESLRRKPSILRRLFSHVK